MKRSALATIIQKGNNVMLTCPVCHYCSYFKTTTGMFERESQPNTKCSQRTERPNQ